MNIMEAFPSAFLNAAALNGGTPTVVIQKIEMYDFDTDGEKPVCYFEGKSAGMVLNKTRANALSAMFGNETDDWIGKPIKLGTVPVQVNGTMKDSICVMKSDGPAPAPTTQAPDDVPF